MHHTFSKKAFTLVELAIVMTIIGLLIGGILKGQELLENARITSTIAQVKSFDAAVSTFRDIYDSLPGDLPNAENRIPGCNANCNPSTAIEGIYSAGDGRVSWDWSDGWEEHSLGNIPATNVGDEAILFWMHLYKANLISGIEDVSKRPELAGGGTTYAGHVAPVGKAGGVYAVATSLGAGTPAIGSPLTESPRGLLLALTSTTWPAANQMPGDALAPARVAQIDRKIDDGKPTAGSLTVWGKTDPLCYIDQGGGNFDYNEQSSVKGCGFMIILQN